MPELYQNQRDIGKLLQAARGKSVAVLSGNFVFPQYVSSDLMHWRLADTPLGEGRLLETIGSDGHPRYAADMLTLKMFETAIKP